MAWKKSPPELVAAFDALVAPYEQAERRSMFGYPAVFLNGNMVVGLHENRIVMRLDDPTAAAAKRRGARDFEPMVGRPMKGWVAVPEEVARDRALVGGWISRAFGHVGAMPKKKSSAKSAAKKKAGARRR
jgi:TfoX/Sxy family transcriptional regulator of competence genes